MEINNIASKLVKPSTPTPSALRNYNLSFFDAQLHTMYVPLILYYSHHASQNQHDVFNHLEISLSETLNDFYPFAGRYFPPAPFVDCSDQGALFLQAKANFHLSTFLALDWASKIDMVPYLLPCDFNTKAENDVPLLNIKITTFECGGVAIAMCFPHKLSDISTTSTFINNWAIRSNKNADNINELKLGKYSPSFIVADRFPQGLCNDLFSTGRQVQDSSSNNININVEKLKFAVRVFSFKGKSIARMRETLVNISRPSKVKLITAILWKAFIDIDVKANSNKRSNHVFISTHTVDLRHKTVVPKLPDNLCGNFFSMAISRIELAGQEDEQHNVEGLLKVLNDSLNKIDSNYVKDGERDYEILSKPFLDAYELLTNKEVKSFHKFSSWCKVLSFQKADFGWGRPVWRSTGNFQMNNFVIMMDDEEGDGVEAWVHLDEKQMSEFEQHPDIQAYTTQVN